MLFQLVVISKRFFYKREISLQLSFFVRQGFQAIKAALNRKMSMPLKNISYT